jgi:hypothetical protein
MVERVIIDTPNTQIHGHSLSWLGTGTSIKSDKVELVLWAQTFPLSEMMGKKSHFILINNFLFAKSWRLFKKENQILSLTSVPRI